MDPPEEAPDKDKAAGSKQGGQEKEPTPPKRNLRGNANK